MSATFHAKGSGAQTTTAASFSIVCTISAGDSVVVTGSWSSASAITPTVKTTGGTGSDTFTAVYGPFDSGNGFKFGGWLLQSAGSGRTGAIVSWASGNPTFADGACWSFSGLTSPVLDQFNAGIGNGAGAITSGNTPVLTTADEFAVAFACSAASITANGGIWTDDGTISATSSWFEHSVRTVTTAIQSTFTNSTGSWVTWILTFRGTTAATLPFGPFDYSKGPFRIRRTQIDPSRSLNPNLFKNPVPNKNFPNIPRDVRRFLPPDASRPTNPNLFKNPVPNKNFPNIPWSVERLLPPDIPYNQALYTVTVTAQTLRTPFFTPAFFPKTSLPASQPYNQSLYTVTITLMGQAWI